MSVSSQTIKPQASFRESNTPERRLQRAEPQARARCKRAHPGGTRAVVITQTGVGATIPDAARATETVRNHRCSARSVRAPSACARAVPSSPVVQNCFARRRQAAAVRHARTARAGGCDSLREWSRAEVGRSRELRQAVATSRSARGIYRGAGEAGHALAVRVAAKTSA